MKKTLLFMAAVVAVASSLLTVAVLKLGEHLARQKSTPNATENVSDAETKPERTSNLPIQFLEKPVSYEGKKKVSVKVIQVFGDSALATEGTLDCNGEIDYIIGKVVMIIGNNHYTDEIVNINNPQQIGLYTYLNGYGWQITVPVIQAESDIINK